MSVLERQSSDGGRPVALITGASAGIGTAFARQLAEQGHNLVVVARRESRLEQLGDELEAEYDIQVEPVAVDLADEQAVEHLAETIESRHDIEVLVNNAGFGLRGPFHEADIAKHLNMIRVHAMATAQLTRAVLPQMIARDRGYVINVSSLAAFLTAPGAVSYCATKAFLNSFSQSLQDELIDTGVRIQALCPGFTYTEFHDVPDAKMDRGLVPRFLWMSAERVVKISLRNKQRKKVVCVPGVANRLLALVMRSHVMDGLVRYGYGRRLKAARQGQ